MAYRLPQKEYLNATLLAWGGLQSQVAPNGTVHGVCMGTGIEDTVEGYNQRGTDYWQSSPGACAGCEGTQRFVYLCWLHTCSTNF